ncbi:uncharacterized protein LOC124419115 [Lucilia cuprina]|uniref:uncharacterized protein LOC124419115 n=1 Tax=Lucilia cuprina TaxID=7375 RepID=UPI001F062A4C|nr:uncharacterized protein LOC124419115 [Lucilia cuprina]
MNSKLGLFMDKVDGEQNSIQQSLMDTIANFRSEMASCFKDIKSEIINCNKLIQHIDRSTTEKIAALEDENNMLHKRLNRGDIVVVGLPAGIIDFVDPIIKIGLIYNVPVLPVDINHAFYFKNQKAILFKFNNVFVRDRIMVEYFKTRALKLCDVIGGDIDSRIYLNDHHSPAAGRLNIVCKKLIRKKVISKFRILNGDRLQVRLTMSDGKNSICDSAECIALLNNGT